MKSIKSFLLSVGMLVVLAAFLSMTPAASIRSEAVGAEVAVGIDVSKYQGSINWQQVKNQGVRFAMIRVGTTKKGLDEQFINNINGANAAGVRTGIYIYSYATTPEAAAAEANQVLAWIAPYTVTFPIAIDIEDSCQKGLSSAQLQAIADTFCGIINANGYEPMVYASRNWFAGRMPNVSAAKWVAQYNSYCDYPGDYAMWQSSSHGTYSGVPTRVDVNHLYVDYFSRIIPEGFNSYGGHVFYYHNYRKQYGWINLSGQRYHADANGFIQTGWFQDESGIYYLDPGQGGLSKVGFADIDGARYYFNENGQRCTGLLNLGGTFYYANEDGVCQKGFLQLEDGVRFFDENYAMRTGLTQIGEELFYFDGNGIMQTGMIALENGKFMFGAGGAAISGWYTDEQGRRYFFGPAKAALVGLQTVEGAVYLFDENGVVTTGWSGDVASRFYFGADGRMLTGWNAIDGKTYYFGADGKMAVGLATIDNAVYYLDPADGHRVVGWAQLPDGWHYFDGGTGQMLANVTVPLENVNCTFNQAGILVDPAGWTPGTPAPAPAPAEAAPADAAQTQAGG
ncbi:MAG: hypothetical protein IJ695_06450 [Butyrivibrio sp.]|nr:hypothetical protein [Butyrivibrio sp.]